MKKEISEFIFQIRFPIFFVVLLWIIESADFFLQLDLANLGIYPRETSGLIGIIASPFIHSNWDHLLSNTLPVLVLTSMMIIFYKKVALKAFFMIMIGTGFLVWLFARESYHIGASGMIYGMVSFVFWTGVFKKNLKSIILSLIVLTLYAGMFTSIFPNTQPNISWESHMFGGLVGLFMAFILRNVIEEDEKEYYISPWSNDDKARQYFLPRDIFEKTKMMRYEEYLEAQRRQEHDEQLWRENNNLLN